MITRGILPILSQNCTKSVPHFALRNCIEKLSISLKSIFLQNAVNAKLEPRDVHGQVVNIYLAKSEFSIGIWLCGACSAKSGVTIKSHIEMFLWPAVHVRRS